MNIEELESTVLNTENKEDLYKLELDLVKLVSQHYKLVAETEDSSQKLKLKANLTLLNSLLSICKQRQSDLKDSNSSFNKNFREISKTVLSTDVYNTIYEKAKQKNP